VSPVHDSANCDLEASLKTKGRALDLPI